MIDFIEFFSQQNWWSALGTIAIVLISGTLYYSPKFMGGPWMKTLDIRPEDFARATNMKALIAISILFSLFLHFFLLHRINEPGQEGVFDSFKHGAWHGAFLSILIVLPALMINGIYELKSMKNLAINALYWIILLTILGGMIDACNHYPNG